MKETMEKKISVSGGELPNDYKAEINLTIDYTDVTREELITRAMRADVITTQRELRKMTTAELDKLAKDGYEVDGTTIGKTQTRSARQILESAGLDEATITAILNNPEKVNELLG